MRSFAAVRARGGEEGEAQLDGRRGAELEEQRGKLLAQEGREPRARRRRDAQLGVPRLRTAADSQKSVAQAATPQERIPPLVGRDHHRRFTAAIGLPGALSPRLVRDGLGSGGGGGGGRGREHRKKLAAVERVEDR